MSRVVVETECAVCAEVLALTCLDGHPKRVLDGFPPEAVEAAAEAILKLRLNMSALTMAETVLDAAWRVLTGDTE